MALSGMSFAGSDIGGFAEQPGRAFARWIGLGISIHSVEFTPAVIWRSRPWTFDENITNITRKFIELRYKLLPYLYTTFWYAEEGTPMLKSLRVV
jgi:alpha-glucosidase